MKILVPVDGSAESIKAAKEAVGMAKEALSNTNDNNVCIKFINVVYKTNRLRYDAYKFEDNSPYYSQYDLNSQTIKENKLRMIDSIIGNFDYTGIKVKKEVLVGLEPYKEIIKIAEEENFDVIVMCKRNLSSIRRFFLGSVTDNVISNTDLPVKVVT